MAYDQHLAERVSVILKNKKTSFVTKNMIGGLCYMISDKMALGIVNNSLLVRIDPGIYDSSLNKKGCRPMDFTGRVMKGFVLVDPVGIDLDKDLSYWIQLSLDFNPKAKASKKPVSGKKVKAAPKKLKR